MKWMNRMQGMTRKHEWNEMNQMKWNEHGNGQWKMEHGTQKMENMKWTKIMKWNEMERNERKWNEMERNERKWNEIKGQEMTWMKEMNEERKEETQEGIKA